MIVIQLFPASHCYGGQAFVVRLLVRIYIKGDGCKEHRGKDGELEYWSNGMVECEHSAGYKGQRKWSGVVMEYEIIEYLKVSEEF